MKSIMVLIHLFWHSNIQVTAHNGQGLINVTMLYTRVRLSIRNDTFQIACLVSGLRRRGTVLCPTVTLVASAALVRASVEIWKRKQFP